MPTATDRKAALRRAFRLCTMEGFVAMPIITMSLPVNVFLTALLIKGLALSKPAIGLITALPFVCNFLQLFLTPMLTRRLSAKRVSLIFALGHLICWLALGLLLPWVPRDDPATAGFMLGVWFFVASFSLAIAAVCWNAWVQEWAPPRLHGKYFGQRNGLLQISTLLFLFTTGYVLTRGNYSILAFQGIIFGALVLRVFSLRWQGRIPAGHSAGSGAPPSAPLAQLQVVRRARSFLLFIAFGAIWSFAANLFGPFYHVFLFEQLSFSAFDLGLLSTIAALGGALSMPGWGRLIDRYGNKSVMALSLTLWQLGNLVWCFVGPANRHWLYYVWAWGGATCAGFVLGQFTMLLKLIPHEARSIASAVNLAVTSLVAAIAPVLGGALLDWALGRWPDALAVYHVCFIVQPVLAMLGALLLLRVQEPRASPFTSLVGAMRNIRTLSGVFGLSFLVNYVFYRPRRR